jgi:hypothetical protein
VSAVAPERRRAAGISGQQAGTRPVGVSGPGCWFERVITSRCTIGVIFDEDYDFEGPRAPKAHLDTVLAKPVTPDLGRQALYTSLGSPCVLVAHHSPDILVPSERSLWACQTALWGVLGSHIADFPCFTTSALETCTK